MALIHCPECGTEISSEAVSCPKCGKPMCEFQLKTPKINDSPAGSFFRLLAIFIWIGGLVVSIVLGDAFSSYNRSYEKQFNGQYFFVALCIFAVSGGFSYCIGKVVDYIYGIYCAVTNLQIVYANKEKLEKKQYEEQISKPFGHPKEQGIADKEQEKGEEGQNKFSPFNYGE